MANCAPFLLLGLALFASTSFAWDGPIKTRSEQCQGEGFVGACDFKNANGYFEYGCVQLRCAEKIEGSSNGSHYVPSYSNKIPVDGTYCGRYSYCYQGECKKHLKKALPEYTGPETNVPNCFSR